MKSKTTIIIAIAAILSLSGCSKKWCNNRYPCIDSTVTETTIQLDTSYIQLPADTVLIELPFDCPDQQIIYKEGKRATRIVVKDRKIYVNQVTAADSVAIISWFKQSKEFKQAVKEVPVSTYYIPKWVYYYFGISILLLIFAYRNQIIKLIKIMV